LDSPSFRPILPLENLQNLLIKPSIMKKTSLPLSFRNLYILAILMVSSLTVSSQTICPAQSEFPWQEWIEDVRIGDLTNYDSGKFRDYSTFGYSDYTDLVSTPIDRSNPVDYRFDGGSSGPYPGDYWTVFIDYNQNGVFDLPAEEVIRGRTTIILGSFSIPEDALSGTTRVRVILSKDEYSGPCDNPAFGEVEDYLITIGEIIPPADLPDLAVGGLIVADQVVVNGVIDYSIKISNLGETPAQEFKFGVFVSTDDVLGSGDQLIEVIDIDNLEPFEIQDIESSLDLNGGPVGDYFIFFKIDKEDVIEESQESNNTIRRNLKIIENTGDEIDLELSLSASIPEPDRFSRSRVTLTLTNNSANEATNIFTALHLSSGEFVFSGNGAVSLTGGGTFSISTGSWYIDNLAGGATATVSFDLFTLTDDFNPCAQVRSVDQKDVDSTPGNGQCPEAVEDDEANLNTIIPPVNTIDLVLESVDIPSSSLSSSQSSGAVQYSRLGTNTDRVQLNFDFILSKDEQLDADDTRIGELNFSSTTTASGNTVTILYDLFGVEPDNYTLFVVMDRLNEIVEVNENNNIASLPFTVEAEAVPDCTTFLGGDQILCSENIGEFTRLYIRDGDKFYSTNLDQNANITTTSPSSPLVYDSTLVEANILTHKLANGTVVISEEIPVSAMDFIPNPTAATRLSTGEYLIAGTLEVGDVPSDVETRVLKLSADLNTVIAQNVIATNDQYPANLRDEVFALFPLDNGEASIIYTIHNVGVTFFSNIQIKKVDVNLNEEPGTSYSRTVLNGITETPCGDLLLNTTLFDASLRGSTIARREVRISKDGSTVSSFWSRGIRRADRIEPREFSLFHQFQDPEFFFNTNFPEDNPPAESIGFLPQPNGDTIQVAYPFFESNYATRNANTGILYGNLNGQIIAVSDCVDPPADGVDIAVELAVSNSNPTSFSKIFYQVTVINQGTETATGLTIDFDYGAQEQPKRLALVNNPNPDYSAWRGIWDIGTLAPREARTFELEVFVLPAAGPSTTRIAEVRSMDQGDINETNDVSQSTIFLEGSASLSEAAEAPTTSAKRPSLSIDNLFPNPAIAEITVALHSQENLESIPLEIFDGFGKMVHSKEISLIEGTNLIRIPVDQFMEGVYLIVLPNGSHQNLAKRFVKMR